MLLLLPGHKRAQCSLPCLFTCMHTHTLTHSHTHTLPPHPHFLLVRWLLNLTRSYSLFTDSRYTSRIPSHNEQEELRLDRVQKLVDGFDAVVSHDPLKARRSEPSNREGVFFHPADTLSLVTSDAMSKVLKPIHVPGLDYKILYWYRVCVCVYVSRVV
jgi:hypothetical protein